MATPKKDAKKTQPTSPWTETSSALLRQYREQTGDELVEELKRRLPKTPDVEKLFELPSKSIVRRQLFREGAEFILKELERLSKDNAILEDPSLGGHEDMS